MVIYEAEHYESIVDRIPAGPTNGAYPRSRADYQSAAANAAYLGMPRHRPNKAGSDPRTLALAYRGPRGPLGGTSIMSAERFLTRFDAMQIAENVTGFFVILVDWARASSPDSHTAPALICQSQPNHDDS